MLRVFGADPAGDLHDERDRESEQHGAAGGADAGAFSERAGGGEADLPTLRKWTQGFWSQARAEFAILFGDRFPMEVA